MKRYTPKSGVGYEIPPCLEHIIIYFVQKNSSVSEAHIFFSHFNNSNWKTRKGKQIKNWKVLAADWIWNLRFNK